MVPIVVGGWIAFFGFMAGNVVRVSPRLTVFLLSMVLAHANGRPHPEADCVPAPFAAWSLVRHGHMNLQDYPTLKPYTASGGPVRVMPDGVWVSRYPPGSTWAMVPFVAPVALWRAEPLKDQHLLVLGKFAGAVYVSIAAVLLFMWCQQYTPQAAWPVTLLFSLGTCLHSVAAQAIWMHGPATCGLMLAWWCLLRRGEETRIPWRAALVVGLALGFATVTRPTAGIFAVATGLTLISQRRYRDTFMITLAGLLPVLVMMYFNAKQFGNPLLGGYAGEYNRESPPMWLGLAGLLIAPSRGLLVYSPALLLLPWGLRAIRQLPVGRGLTWTWFAGALITLLYYARWHDWKGGWCFGPRFLCETLPVLCVIVALAIEHHHGRWFRRVAWGLVGLSITVHQIGALGYAGYADWQKRHDLPDHGRCLFELNDTQIEAHARAIWQKLLGNKSR